MEINDMRNGKSTQDAYQDLKTTMNEAVGRMVGIIAGEQNKQLRKNLSLALLDALVVNTQNAARLLGNDVLADALGNLPDYADS